MTGMGRGPGNACIEELAIEAEELRGRCSNLIPLFSLIRNTFGPMKAQYGWGTNPYYYLAGKYGIHPTYIQEMMSDSRYKDEDILSVINYFRDEGGSKFSFDSLVGARQFYSGEPCGSWSPSELMSGREVLILGSGPSVKIHNSALETYIRRSRPIVIALNTQSALDSSLIDLRIACHPVRMLADAQLYSDMPQPLITPVSMLPEHLKLELQGTELLDFGFGIKKSRFEFYEKYCIIPNPLVLAYALAVVVSGKADQILMAGFDGYSVGDSRNDEVDSMLSIFFSTQLTSTLFSITNTRYNNLPSKSIYAM